MKITLEKLFSLIPNIQTFFFISSGISRTKVFEGTKAKYQELCDSIRYDGYKARLHITREVEEIRIIGDAICINLIDPEEKLTLHRRNEVK